MKPPGLPKGWDEERVSGLLDHYETQSEEESVAEDEVIWLDSGQTVMRSRPGSYRRCASSSPDTRKLPEQPRSLLGSSTAEMGSADTLGRLTTISQKISG